MGNLWRDVRFGWRMLAKHKGFTVVAILALALGIGPNTAIFSVVYATLLAPLPYPESDRLVVIWAKIKGERNIVPGDDYLEYARQSRSFEYVAGNHDIEFNLASAEEPVQITGSTVTPDFYTMLKGWSIAMGREISAEDGEAGKDHVVVLNHRMWVERFHSDPNIIGKRIRFDGQAFTVIGVRKPGPPDRMQQEFQIPLILKPGPDGHVRDFVCMFGRMKPGVPIETVQAELAAITSRVVANHPKDFPKDWKISVEPLKNDFLSPSLKQHLWLLMGIVGFVLLIACANVANLLLVRGASREKEVAVRASLGASTVQLFRQFLAESLTLAVLGGAAGVLLGSMIMEAVVALLPPFSLPSEAEVRINQPVLFFTVGVSILSGVLFGCVPAWQAARLDLGETLKQGARAVMGGGRKKLQRVLVAGEFALAITLLTAAGLAIHSYWNLAKIDSGVRTDHVLTAYLPGLQKHFAQPAQIGPFFRQMIEKIDAVPGVYNAAVTTNLPMQGHTQFPFGIPGRQAADPSLLQADLELVTPGYFPALHVRLDRGRQFDNNDTAATEPVVMVSDDFARRWFPNENPLSRALSIAEIDPGKPNALGKPVSRRIIGIFHSVRNGGQLRDQAVPQMFVPFWQNPWPNVALVVRTGSDPAALAKNVARAVHEVAPAVPLTHVQTMDQIVDSQLAADRFGTLLYAGFGALALLLAAVGIYGVMAFAVAQRRHEIGLRMALGAGGGEVVNLILKDGMKLAAIGLLAGAAGAYLAGHLMRATLYGIGSIDGLSFAAVCLILLVSALIASYVPASRATKVDPMTALRQE